MLLHEGLTHIQSQIKPWLLIGESFALNVEYHVELIYIVYCMKCDLIKDSSSKYLFFQNHGLYQNVTKYF